MISQFIRDLVLSGPIKFDLIKTVNHAIHGLREYKKINPDIVITDIRMPEMDGLTLIREFRKYNPESVIIIITGYNEFEYAKKAIQYGVFNYILKPIEQDLFYDTLNNAMKLIKKKKESVNVVRELRTSLKKLQEEFITYSNNEDTNDNMVDNIIIGKVIKYINDNYSSDLSQEEVAAKVFISPGYLSELFKRLTGKKFINYVTEVKVEKAKKLLSCPNLKIQEISHMVGYRNVSYFIRVFSRNVSMSPNEYRGMLLAGSAPYTAKCEG